MKLSESSPHSLRQVDTEYGLDEVKDAGGFFYGSLGSILQRSAALSQHCPGSSPPRVRAAAAALAHSHTHTAPGNRASCSG